MSELKSPRAARPRGHEEKNLTQGSIADSFPRCQLHGCKIVDRFPRDCALSAENPLDALHTIKNEAFAATHENTNESGHLFRVLDCCESCVSQNISHPTVHRLRVMGNDKSVNAHNPAQVPAWKRNGKDKSKPVRGRGRWYLQEVTIHG